MSFERKPIISFPDASNDQFNFTVLVRGHVVDPVGVHDGPFPEWASLDYRSAIWNRLNAIHNQADTPISRLITSGRAGAELTAVNWAIPNNRPVQLYLPYDQESFLRDDVNYGEHRHNWERIFKGIGKRSQDRVHVPVLEDGTPGLKEKVECFSQPQDVPMLHQQDLNLAMLDQLKKTDLVLAVWDGKIASAPEIEHLVEQAKKRGIGLQILDKEVADIVNKYTGSSFV